MKIAILGGSFNPVHIGHLWIAQQVLENELLKIDEVWFMPNYTSKKYSLKKLADWRDRHEMCRLAKDDFDIFNHKMKVCNLEAIERFEYTYQTINYLVKHYPKDRFYWVIGSDWDITKFKNYRNILTKCRIIIMERAGYKLVTDDNYLFLTANVMSSRCNVIVGVKQHFDFKISSTDIRNRIKEGMKITGLVTQSVEKYIHDKGLYASK